LPSFISWFLGISLPKVLPFLLLLLLLLLQASVDVSTQNGKQLPLHLRRPGA
jgi:hypothetical protein